MKSAYLYIRVSTDEQKRRGFSLPEQEDRLLKYCEFNDIKINGIFREDFSAKNFNRPEWKKLIATVKQSASKEANNFLFVKWDRFSRNIEYAYEMIGILRKYNTTARAIDQLIDFEVPESSLVFAVYLAIPEAENGRRSLNSANGIRRAKQMGRYTNKAPLGYINITGPDGKKYIVPHQPEADLIKWSFQQLAKNAYRIEDVRRMANNKGLICSRSNFWKLLHNSVYCGYVSFSSNEFEGRQLVKAIHQPIITESLFYEVQNIIDTKRKILKKTYEENEMFMLRKYLICPACHCKLYGSFSRGRSKTYPYYHCKAGCKTRFKADVINNDYENKLKKIKLSSGVMPLFDLVLKDINVNTQLGELLNERNLLLKQIDEQELFLAKARKLFVTGKVEFDDFSKLKKDYVVILKDLNDELKKIMIKLSCIDKHLNFPDTSFNKKLSEFKGLDVNDKKHIIDFIPPNDLDNRGLISLQLNSALSKMMSLKKTTLISTLMYAIIIF
jgi:site-specific DNA recombinase